MYVAMGQVQTAEKGGIASVAAQIECAAMQGKWDASTGQCLPAVPQPSASSGGGGGGGGGIVTAAPSTATTAPSRAALTFGGVIVVGLLVAGGAYMLSQRR